MSATLLYRIAAVLFVLFALGHTVGFLTFVPPTPAGIAARDAMDSAVFAFGGVQRTYGGFYRGFGLCITLYLLVLALFTWHLGSLAATNPTAIGPMAWTLCLSQVVGFVLTCMYFGAPPAVFSAVIAVLLAVAALKKS